MKRIKKNYLMISALAIMLIACLTGGTMLLSANAQDEPTSTVKLTSYTTVLSVGEEFTFAAEVTLEDGTTSDEVTWTSSEDTVISMAENIATANAEGTATITATAADGAFASVDVLVSDTAIRVISIAIYPEVLDLGVGWTERLDYTVFPQDAYEQGATWASSNPSVVTVDENGNVKAIGAGSAKITVTARDTFNYAEATCSVEVYADLEEATLTPDTLTMDIGEQLDFTINLPEGVELEERTSHWYSSEDSVASIDRVVDNVGTAFSWSYGTTTIYAVAHGNDGKVYAAMGTVHVTAKYFYLTGLESILTDPADDPWVTYPTEDAAREAGVLLVPDENNPYVYSLTRSFWANDIFQILHNDMDEDWTTKITSASFVEQGSTMDYVANTADSFGVNALGAYIVTLDLSDGRAKVTIAMDSLEVTSLELSVASENAYLQYVGPDGEETARTMTLDVATLPAKATYDPADVLVTVPEDMQEYVTAEPQFNADGALQIVLTLLKAPEANTSFQLNIAIDNGNEKLENANDDITVTILADGKEYVEVTDIHFTSASYLINVNNGAKPWISSTPVEAVVDADASVQGIVYSTSSNHIWVEYVDGQAYAHADALGTYTITATALGNSEVTATTKVLVTSLIGEAEPYQSGFYLIGQLDGEIVENWTSIAPDQTTFEGSDFAKWTLPIVEGETDIYSISTHLAQYDRFSIAFLGMDGNWFGIINNQYMNWADSVGTYWESDGNIETTVAGTYTITLDLSAERPSFTVKLVQEDVNTYDLTLYIVRGGDAWDPAVSEETNILATVGSIHIENGIAQELTLTLDSLTLENMTWPTIQFVTARGIEGGYFYGETWYGDSYTDLQFTGDGYSEEGAENHFGNSNNGILYWVGEYTMGVTQITTSFTFTFNESGVLTEIAVGAVTVTTTE